MNGPKEIDTTSNILIVDDKPEELRLLSTILKRQGHTVRTLPEGSMVLPAVLRHPPDIILMDILMPGMDGYTVCEQLKADKRVQNIPVIFISVLDDVVDKVKGFKMGGVDYISKPFQEEEVLARVNTHIALIRSKQKLEIRNRQLQESEELFQNLFNSMHAGVVLISSDGRIVKANPVAESILGLKRGEIESKHYDSYDWDILRTDGTVMPSEEKAGSRAMKEKRSIQNQLMGIRQPDGTISWINASAIPILDPDNKLDSVVCTFADVTKLKQAEEELRESEARLKALSEAPFEAIFLSEKGVCLDQNQAAERMFGYTRADAVGRHGTEFFVPEERERVKNNILSGYEKPYEATALRKNGTTFSSEIQARMIDYQDRSIRVTALRDITDRKRVEKQIKASLREKEVLLREIHHRVKNNMQIISSLLKIQARHIKDKQAAEKFEDSQGRITSMSLIHEQLYQSENLSRIDFGNYARRLVNSSLGSYGPGVEKIDLKVETQDIFLGIDVAIPLGLVINELISNSFKHAFPDGREGTVTISIQSTEDNWVELMIGDNGVGIPKNIDFKDLKTFGLELVKDLVEHQLSGKIEIKSDMGTEYHIKFMH